METSAREMRAYVRFGRGDVEGALDDWQRGLALAREMGDPSRLMPALFSLGRALSLIGRLDEARALVVEGIDVARANPTIGQLAGIGARESALLGLAREVAEVIERAPDGPWKEAGLASIGGEHSRAADLFERMGVPSIEADARLAAAESLLAEGRTAEGLGELEKALAFYRSVRATFFLERAEALLAEARTA
jgi:tetratricopeptide (TPR) repeat protein